MKWTSEPRKLPETEVHYIMITGSFYEEDIILDEYIPNTRAANGEAKTDITERRNISVWRQIH